MVAGQVGRSSHIVLNFPEISMKSAGKGTIAMWRKDFQYMDVAGAQNKA